MNGGEDGERWKDMIEDKIKTLEVTVDGLVTWRSWIIGAVAGIGIMTGAFAKQIAAFIRSLGG